MPKFPLPISITLDAKTARRFLLAHHGLMPPRAMAGKTGILEYIARVGCIQYDTINVVGRNADLVLQSRVKNYSPEILDSLLYQERLLIDGWDKLASLYLTSDWPYFARQRQAMVAAHRRRNAKTAEIEDHVIERITSEGPLSSLAFDHDESGEVAWFWGPTKLARAALETLFATGELGIHHKIGTRRIFERIENLLPESLIKSPDPNKTLQDYHDWHVHRRVGSMGLATLRSAEYWLGIRGMKSPERLATIIRLTEQGALIPVAVEGTHDQPLFIRSKDLQTLRNLPRRAKDRAAFIAPLDNLIWNRKFIASLFGFDYIWEVYKPPAKRRYGYYTLPVLYGDCFIARVDSKLDRKTNTWNILGWWWETGVEIDSLVYSAIQECIQAFIAYLGATDASVSFEGPVANQIKRLL